MRRALGRVKMVTESNSVLSRGISYVKSGGFPIESFR
jgi:hypothetical protein